MDSREPSGPQPPPQPTQPPSQPTQSTHPPGLMAARASFGTTAGLPNSHGSSPMISPSARFPFNSVVSPPTAAPSASKPLDSLNSPPFNGSPPGLRPCGFAVDSSSGKKKRGRPRKYAPDGNIALALVPTPIPASGPGESGGNASPASDPPVKRHRGRPPGSGKKQLDALGSAGIGFTPHVIMVKAGEDIASKIMAFSQQGPRTVSILSANGAICNVTLRQPAMTGGTVSYEGRFEIISLSGSFLLSDNNGSRSRIGGLSVSLAGTDGRVLGGGVAGMLMAATPVQVVVGSFLANGKKTNSSRPKSGPSSTPPPQMLNFSGSVAPASPTSQGPSSESSDENGGSPLNRGSGGFGNNASQPVNNVPMYSPMGWGNSTMKMLPN